MFQFYCSFLCSFLCSYFIYWPVSLKFPLDLLLKMFKGRLSSSSKSALLDLCTQWIVRHFLNFILLRICNKTFPKLFTTYLRRFIFIFKISFTIQFSAQSEKKIKSKLARIKFRIKIHPYLNGRSSKSESAYILLTCNSEWCN